MNINEILAEKLRKFRKQSELTQQQVADAIGIKRSAYAYYEIGKSAPKLSTLTNLAKLYNVSLDEFLIDEQEQLKVSANEQEYALEDGVDNTFIELSDFEKAVLLKLRLLSSEQRKKIISDLYD